MPDTWAGQVAVLLTCMSGLFNSSFTYASGARVNAGAGTDSGALADDHFEGQPCDHLYCVVPHPLGGAKGTCDVCTGGFMEPTGVKRGKARAAVHCMIQGLGHLQKELAVFSCLLAVNFSGGREPVVLFSPFFRN